MNDYFELKIKINPEISEILSEICFENLPCEGVVLAEEKYDDDLCTAPKLVSTTEDTLKVYIREESSASDLKEKCKSILNEQRNLLIQREFSEEELGSWDFELEKVQNQDWSKKWKENWDITPVTENITIVPSWIDYTPKENEVTITLDPGSAFGTGTHPTTQLCMQATEAYIKQNDKMADIGTGSGVLAICAVKLGAEFAYGCDNDETVIETAIENAKLNNVSENCLFEHKTADKVNEKFDFITANILHNVLAEIMGDLKALMADNATLVLSGILDEKKPIVIDAIKKHGLELVEEIHQDIWVGLVVKN